MKLGHLVGRCFFCKRTHGAYDPNQNRFCCTQGLSLDVGAKFGDQLALFPTIYPEPAESDREFSPPEPHIRPGMDAFAIALETRSPRQTKAQTMPSLPYPANCAELDHGRCGHAAIYSLGASAASFGFAADNVQVCDLTTYPWSRTLKDPRSWAVVRTALACGVRHLGVWTTGNAGFSLARVAYEANRFLPADRRLHVYCYTTSPMANTLRGYLQAFDAKIAFYEPTALGEIVRVQDTLERMNARLDQAIPLDEYWDVSDGWDGVGLYMYRLLARQLCRHLKPDYVVLPVGTGDLFFGFYLGRRDCVAGGYIEANSCRLIAAIPQGDSVLKNYHKYGLAIPLDGGGTNTGTPVAPKLTIVYTPLLLVMYEALRNEAVEIVEVDLGRQQAAAQLLMQGGSIHIASEPSALIAFGALKDLAAKHLGSRGGIMYRSTKAKVLVVNSGCGLMGPEELDLLGECAVPVQRA